MTTTEATYFFCVMTSPKPGVANYSHGTLKTACDPSTTDGFNTIVREISKALIPPPVSGIVLVAFNRI